MSSRFDTIPACDGQMGGHTMTANTVLAWRYTVTKVDTVAGQQWTLTDWTKNLHPIEEVVVVALPLLC